MFSDNRPGKGNSNTCRSCTDSDSGYSSHGGVDLETGSDVWYLRLPRFLVWKRSLFFNAFLSARCCAHAEIAVVLCICGCLCIRDTVGRIDLVFGTDPSHNLSYAEIRVRANKLHFPLELPPPPNSGHRKFRHGTLMVAACCQLIAACSSTKVNEHRWQYFRHGKRSTDDLGHFIRLIRGDMIEIR